MGLVPDSSGYSLAISLDYWFLGWVCKQAPTEQWMSREKGLTYRLKTRWKEWKKSGAWKQRLSGTKVQCPICMPLLFFPYLFFGRENTPFIFILHLDTLHLPFGSKLSWQLPRKPFDSLLGWTSCGMCFYNSMHSLELLLKCCHHFSTTLGSCETLI